MRYFIIFCITAVLLSAAVSAISIEPSELIFEDVLQDGYAEKILTVSTDSYKPVQLTLSATEPIKEWISFDPSSDSVSAGSPIDIKVMLNMTDSQLKKYKGYVIVNSYSSNNEVTTAMSQVFEIRTSIDVSKNLIEQANVANVVLDDTEQGMPLTASVTVENQGNSMIEPFFSISVLDSGKKEVFSAGSKKKSLLPYSKGMINISLPSGLAFGEYNADIEVHAGDMLLSRQTRVFNIVEKGSVPKQEEKISDDQMIPLSTNWIILAVWGIIFVFIVSRITKSKLKKKR
ncbi:hypothetical protein GF336_04525 [Candidatus Woesearchaeota archaeon]|nr:hypothetical protein [Candidatus Woesearchaeota archaeon]